MGIKELIEYLPALAVIISLVGLFGNFWQNYYANKSRVTERTDDMIRRFEREVVEKFNRVTLLIEEEKNSQFTTFEEKTSLTNENRKDILISISNEHADEITQVFKNLNQLTYLLSSNYVDEIAFKKIVNPDIGALVGFLESEENEFSLSEICNFLKTIKYNGVDEDD
ncbi:MAG: hypothetical protein LBM27_02290 [Lactobacillaceae bacterium]|jgi:hypothetical protein|nr:hypothetical protein [Lactobacillaceae bacterium]